MNRFMQVVVVSTGVFFSQSGLAAHPLITDDTGTQGRGKSQIEANAEYAYDKEQISGITVKATGTDAAMFLFCPTVREYFASKKTLDETTGPAVRDTRMYTVFKLR